ncbi:hypothetical protein GOBAR_AA00280 [Gossypium barbadense]|uniref:Uncharacterized protein n=1 Tax=Gossypium barbadense TaxID=3634 RepID=A0A2P5YXF8_GOSBA|nr:hypothetical protein GOBAR_AA00280 [Gossypium barbadense]
MLASLPDSHNEITFQVRYITGSSYKEIGGLMTYTNPTLNLDCRCLHSSVLILPENYECHIGASVRQKDTLRPDHLMAYSLTAPWRANSTKRRVVCLRSGRINRLRKGIYYILSQLVADRRCDEFTSPARSLVQVKGWLSGTKKKQ